MALTTNRRVEETSHKLISNTTLENTMKQFTLIVLYCRSGRTSEIAAGKLFSLEYTDIWNLKGGMLEWEQAGYEIEKQKMINLRNKSARCQDEGSILTTSGHIVSNSCFCKEELPFFSTTFWEKSKRRTNLKIEALIIVWKEKNSMHATHRDPVCGMEVTPETAEATSEYQGRTYYFCSASCKESFDKNPQNYVMQEE